MNNKPKFSTFLRQAREQCQKQYDVYDMLSMGDVIVKFFASGMEYRCSHTHVEAERTFLSCNHQIVFLMGYLQGKGADTEMINNLSEDAVRFFMDGLFYEEYLLEGPNNHVLD